MAPSTRRAKVKDARQGGRVQHAVGPARRSTLVLFFMSALTVMLSRWD
jgi:hypothetical protein